jgi:DNA-binding MarR family transcriptional regulator
MTHRLGRRTVDGRRTSRASAFRTIMGTMSEPLSSALSRTLVAFTIEADDEFEHRMPHRTTNHGTTAAPGAGDEVPWLVSLLMSSMCMRFIPPDGTTVRSYARSAWWLTPKGLSTTLRRMSGWWGYLCFDEAAGSGPSARADRFVRPTAGGHRAHEAWDHLIEDVEGRWCDRLGQHRVRALRSALQDLVGQFDRPRPDCLPLYDIDLDRKAPRSPEVPDTLHGLLSQAIIAFEEEFESAHPVPLHLCGNVLRVLGDGPMPVKDLAARTGLAKDGVEGGLRALQHRKLATVGPDPSGRRLRVASLTRIGSERHRQAVELTGVVEERWRQRYGKQRLDALADALTPIAGPPENPTGPLWAGLYRYEEGWRSSLPRPDTLPHHPVVSHRGGYLDGA